MGAVVLEAAYLERVLRAAFSALLGSKYAALVDARLTVAALIEDCERITRHRTDVPDLEKDGLLKAGSPGASRAGGAGRVMRSSDMTTDSVGRPHPLPL